MCIRDSLREAAVAEGVHRNTLAYRIGRISELFDLDFSNSSTCFELLFSCMLYADSGFGKDTVSHGHSV